MSTKAKIHLTGLVPAEQLPRNIRVKGKCLRWFYVGRSECSFYKEKENGVVDAVTVPTRAIQRALCSMELQVARQRAMRKRKAKKGKSR